MSNRGARIPAQSWDDLFMSKIRLGIVGVGAMGQAAHLRNYAIHPDVEIAAIAEIRPQLGKKVAERYGIPKAYNGHKELLANETLDGIVAIQPFGMHIDIVPDLLEKRVPVLTEKPLAESIASGEKILTAAKKTGTPLYLAYHKRSDPATAFVKKQIEDWTASGIVGKMKYIRVTMPPGDWIAEGFSQQVQTDEKYAANWGDWRDPYIQFVNYYIHQVNLIRFLAGDFQIIAADPHGVTFTALGDNGVTIVLEMAPYQTSIDWQESALISFEKGWIKLDMDAPVTLNRAGRVTMYEDPGNGATPRTIQPTLPWIHAMRQQAMHFVNAIKGETTPLATAEVGLKDLQTATQYLTVRNEMTAKYANK
jgi:predicted dehydrogenase